MLPAGAPTVPDRCVDLELCNAETPSEGGDSAMSTPDPPSTKRARQGSDSDTTSAEGGCDTEVEHPSAKWPTAVPQVPPPCGSVVDEPDDASAWRNAPKWCNSEYAVLRPTPYHSVNQGIADEINVIRMHRRLTGATYSEMAYMRAAAAVKAVPFPLCGIPRERVAQIKGVGHKMSILIAEYCARGSIAEADDIRQDKEIHILRVFAELHGIGPAAALSAYRAGCRTPEDAVRWRGTRTGISPAENLRLFPQLSARIPRHDVAHIGAEVRVHADWTSAVLRRLLPNCVSTICGSYRRGAESSGDIDLVASGAGEPGHVLHELVGALRAHPTVAVVHVLGVSGHDGVSTANVVILHRGVHRRMDVVYARPAQYGAALLLWTGGVVYERDLRRWAQKRGLRVCVCVLTAHAEWSLSRPGAASDAV